MTDLTDYGQPVPPDPATQTSAALVDTWQALMDVHPEAWIDRTGGVTACATGIPTPALNGVFVSTLDPDPADIRRYLAEMRRRGLPHMLQLRPETHAEAVAVPAVEEMTPADDVPLMRLDDLSALEHAARELAPGLAVRQIEPRDARLHAEIASAGFGEELDFFIRLLPPPVMASEGMRVYVGEVDAELVSTALGVTRDGAVGIFNVATTAAHRRRGYGAAITARAIQDGVAGGASWAWLQSSPSGYGVYEALGFRTLERWRCWVSA